MQEEKKKSDGFPCVGEDCIHCGLCAKNCPVGAISVDREAKSWAVNKSTCILCGTCAVKCPKHTITIDKTVNRPSSALSKKSFALPINVPLSKGVLVVQPRLCAGCENCMYACSLTHEGVAAPHLSRIRMNYAAALDGYFDRVALPCQQCVDPECMRYCPCNAISIDKKTGARVINEDLCIGCMECIRHCAYNPPRIAYDDVKKKAIKCDLCGGDPACVKACPSGALTFMANPDGIKCGYGSEGV